MVVGSIPPFDSINKHTISGAWDCLFLNLQIELKLNKNLLGVGGGVHTIKLKT